MEISIDISAVDVLPDIGIARDGVGNTFELLLPGLVLTISHEQLASLHAQIRPWFDADE